MLLFGSIVLAFTLRNVIAAAHQAIGWFVAATVLALLLTPLVRVLERSMRRGFAILLVLLGMAILVGSVAYGVFHDVSSQFDRLQRAVPQAARELERDPRLGETAREFRLEERATAAVDNLGSRLTGEAQAAARSTGAYFAGTVLTIFMLTWVDRMIAAGLAQVDDERRRERLRAVVAEALLTWRRYVTGAVLQSFGFGLAAFVACRIAGLPAPVPLALWVALWALLPYLGLLVGMVPLLLLSAGLESFRQAYVLLALFLALQVVQVVIQQRLHRRSLYVGPGVVLVVGLLGHALYAIGGAVYAIAVAVFALALADAAATDEPPAAVLDPMSPDPDDEVGVDQVEIGTRA